MSHQPGETKVRQASIHFFEWTKMVAHSILAWFAVSCCAYVCLIWFTILAPDGAIVSKRLPILVESRSLLTNILASFLLYYLVSHLPEMRRRIALRTACRKMYRNTKRQILFDILQGSQKGGRTDIEIHYEFVDYLMNVSNFRKFFEGGRESDEGFYAFRNHIQSNEDDFRSIIFKLNLIARQLEFLLNNVPIKRQKNLEDLKRLEQWLLSLDELHAGYDEEKILDNAIWFIFAGWSNADGYGDYDPIEKVIDEI